MTHLHFRLKCVCINKFHTAKFHPREIEDLKLWRKLLINAASIGCNINHITFTHTSIVNFSDGYEFVIGGFVLGDGAWYYKLPPHLIGVFHINLLEFIAAELTFEFAIHTRDPSLFPHRILAFTDNSSALGWLFCLTFDPNKQPHHDAIA